MCSLQYLFLISTLLVHLYWFYKVFHFRWIIVYPAYLNSRRTVEQGRRVPKTKVRKVRFNIKTWRRTRRFFSLIYLVVTFLFIIFLTLALYCDWEKSTFWPTKNSWTVRRSHMLRYCFSVSMTESLGFLLGQGRCVKLEQFQTVAFTYGFSLYL